MDVIKTGLNLGKTFKNMGRFREILTVFARNGFEEFVTFDALNIIPDFVIPKSKRKISLELKHEKDIARVIGRRLALSFEELGPTFVKLGQILSSREDIFPEAFIDEMKRLRDKVKAVEFDQVKEILEKSLSCSIDEVFSNVEKVPLGMASIAVVHGATLKTGEDVVIKVRRPKIKGKIQNDIDILVFMAERLEKVSDVIKYLGIKRVVHDFAISIQHELNFNVEALNAERFRKNLNKVEDSLFCIPKIYHEYNSEKVLVMERIHGDKFSDEVAMAKKRDELVPKLEKAVQIIARNFLEDGFYHADLHGGNFFYMPSGKIGLIDFGMMGSLSKKSRISFVAILYALLNYDFENMVFEFLNVAEFENVPDADALTESVKDALAPYVGLSVEQTDFTFVLKAISKALADNKIYLPREWLTIFRALIALDGVGKSLKIELDLFAIMEKDIKKHMLSFVSGKRIAEEFVWTAKDLISPLRMLPRHLKWMLKDFSQSGHTFKVELKHVEENTKIVTSSIKFLAQAIMVSAFVLAGVLILPQNVDIISMRSVPLLSWVFWGLAFFSYLRAIIL